MNPADSPILVVTPDLAFGRKLETLLGERSLKTHLLPPGMATGNHEAQDAPIAIVDIQCPASTLELLIKNHDHVIVTGDGKNPTDVLAALRVGANDFLARDLETAELDSALVRVANRLNAPSALIEVETQGSGVRQVPVHGTTFTIGRDPTNDLCLDSVVVSRFHARIERKNSRYVVTDCGSRHGVYVDDRKADEQPLVNGAKIRLGTAGAPVLLFRIVERPADADATGKPPDTRRDTHSPDATDSSQEMRDIAALLDTFLKLNGDLLLDDLLQIVVARSIELAEAERGLILLAAPGPVPGHPEGSSPPAEAAPGSLEAETGARLRLAMARHRDGSPIEESGLLISHKIPGDVMQTGQGVILEDLLAPEKASAHPTTIELGVRSAMCVPLRVRRPGAKGEGPKVLGVLYVDSTTRTRPFSQRLLHALESLASEAAQAIFNSRLYEESLQKRALDAEMRIARTIQKSLLPPSAYRNGWLDLYGSSQASSEVGGDLLDYYPFEEDRINVVVGDVSGKGIPAAIFSSMLDGLCYGLGAQASATLDLGKSAGELNRYLVSKSGIEKFVSVIFGTLRANGKFTYVNAGHNPPLLVRVSGVVEVLTEHGVIMGMFEEAQYSTSEVHLVCDDVLILYSDGVTEARAQAGERLGIEKLKSVAARARTRSAMEIHGAILAEVARFSAGAPPSDDVTLMVVKYRGAESTPPGAFSAPLPVPGSGPRLPS